MAYRYEDFERAANDAGLGGAFNESDLAIARQYPEYGLSLVSLRRDLNNATTNEQKLLATEAENQLRKNYAGVAVPQGTATSATPAGTVASGTEGTGLSFPMGGTASSATGGTVSGAASAPEEAASVSPEELQEAAVTAPAQQKSEYQQLLDQAINGREEFEFDPETSDIWSTYKKMYNREGDRAAQNALANAAAASGGRVSSWASTAMQEANNYYAGKLMDMLPTLRNQERGEYESDYNMLLKALDAAYQGDRAAAGDRQQAYENLVSVILQTGLTPNAEQLAAAGMTEEEAAALKAASKHPNYGKKKRSSGGGGGYGGPGKQNDDNEEEEPTADELEAALQALEGKGPTVSDVAKVAVSAGINPLLMLLTATEPK